MSEPKAYRIIQGDTGGCGAPSYKCDTNANRIEEWSDACEVYDKFEADKVIADLEESHKMEVEQLLMEIVKLKADYKEACDRLQTANIIKDEQLAAARHHKYKRCLAMAKECEATALWCYPAANTLPTGFKATLFGKPVMIEPDRLYNRFERLIKWSNRWLKIAEQFKEAK